jgi:hypothetical protein
MVAKQDASMSVVPPSPLLYRCHHPSSFFVHYKGLSIAYVNTNSRMKTPFLLSFLVFSCCNIIGMCVQFQPYCNSIIASIRFLTLLFILLVSNAQTNPQDSCINALIAFANGQHQPIDTSNATTDNVNGGACDGITIGETPGVWFAIVGTGQVIRASTCHASTQIKVKITLFSATDGTCNTLVCGGVSLEPDFECPLSTLSSQTASDRTWSSPSTRMDFPTVKGAKYYLLVQQLTPVDAGVVMMNFRAATLPQHNDCFDAIGPIPRDGTLISQTNLDASISTLLGGYCNYQEAVYPGVWYQFFGNGKNVEISACAVNNVNGFYFSVYEAADCSDLACVFIQTDTIVNDGGCAFQTSQDGSEATFVQRVKFRATVPTKDGYRYYVYLHYARTEQDTVTSSDLRFFVNDELDGNGNQPDTSFGPSAIKYRESQYGMGEYEPGKNNTKNFYEHSNGDGGSTGGGGSGDVSSKHLNRIAAMSSFISFAIVLM